MMRVTVIVCHFLAAVLFACNTPAQTISPNRLQGAPGTLYLESGDSISGRLWLNNEVLVEQNIEVQPNTGQMQQLHLLDVKGYAAADGSFYELKHTGNHIHPRSGFYFMKRLTPEGSAMHLFEHIQRRQKSKSMLDVAYEPVYYLQLADEKMHRVYASAHRRLVPHFHKKMGALIKDCPVVQQKVLKKTPGYFYSRLDATEEKRKNVLLRIIEEYNACSKSGHGVNKTPGSR